MAIVKEIYGKVKKWKKEKKNEKLNPENRTFW